VARRREEGLPDAYEQTPHPVEGPSTRDRLDVAAAVATLPRDLQRAVFLRYWAGKTEAEIASALGAPIGTIKVRLHRARARLADALGADPR
jgi:RNA polymerase sigma-70 factor (ECF subfamily)